MMDVERWRQIDALLQAALEREPAERDSFLEEACSGDESLKKEVQSLLSSGEHPLSIMDTPAFESATALLSEHIPELAEGELISHYRILSFLNSGGMGEVYLAEDTKLHRRVAIKLLLTDNTFNGKHLNRFLIEAQAASTLNHPNILTIYEIGQFEGHHFIVSEFIEGETLRQLLGREHVGLRKVLDIAIQTASALFVAHEAGIVHRDIKPENLMLRSDGYIKVLDFGLAKSSKRQELGEESITTPGLLLGTVKYMSPEQARGLNVDSRSDIFSLGVVMYEMVAGRAPFEGATSSDLIAALLKDEPIPLKHYSPSMPDELQRIITRTLHKDREARYQDLQSMVDDLKRLKQELEVSYQRSEPQHPINVSTATVSNAQAATHTADGLTISTGDAEAIPTSSTQGQITDQLKRRKIKAAGILLTLLVTITVIIYGVGKLSGKKRLPFQDMRIARLTSSGKIYNAAISPDGRKVVYKLYENGLSSLWLKDLSAGRDGQILAPAEAGFHGLTFSPDGNYIYYILEGNEGTLYRIPVSGGEATKLVTDIFGGVTFSPDGTRMAFTRGGEGDVESDLIVANADGTREQKLATRKPPGTFLSAAWSPDGKVIACSINEATGDDQGNPQHVVEVRIADGAERAISGWWRGMLRIAWLSDGSGLLMTGSERIARPRQIWLLPYPGGEARRITNDANNYDEFSLTADSSRMIAVQPESPSSIWIAQSEDTRLARDVVLGANKGDGRAGLSWTPDGRLLYESDAGQDLDVWIMDPDGSNRRQLTSDPEPDFEPVMTPDGQYIVFISVRNGWSIWRMNADGSNLRQLTQVGRSTDIECSQDSQWVVYLSRESGGATLRKISIEGGEPIELSNKLTARVAISPDGKLIAGFYLDEQTKRLQIRVIPFSGGDPVKVFDTPAATSGDALRWTPDRRALTYLCNRASISNIWSQPLDGSPPRQLTDFKTHRIAYFDWSPDGRQLAIARMTESSDLVLISDFK